MNNNVSSIVDEQRVKPVKPDAVMKIKDDALGVILPEINTEVGSHILRQLGSRQNVFNFSRYNLALDW